MRIDVHGQVQGQFHGAGTVGHDLEVIRGKGLVVDAQPQQSGRTVAFDGLDEHRLFALGREQDVGFQGIADAALAVGLDVDIVLDLEIAEVIVGLAVDIAAVQQTGRPRIMGWPPF